MELLTRAAAVTLGVLLALGLLAAFGLYYNTHPLRSRSPNSPAALGWSYESIALTTADGLTIRGWYIPRAGNADGRRAIIVLHGYPFDKGDILGVTHFLHSDYDLLLIDFRYFGESEGSWTSLGLYEWQDLLVAVEYLRGRGVSRIGVWGFSFGAAVALLTLPHTDHIDAVAADTPYTDLGSMTWDYYRYFPLVDRIIVSYTDLLSRLVLGVHPSEISPLRAASGSRLPILLIHGAADATIPIAHFERLRQALAGNPNAEFWLMEGVDHGYTYAMQRDEYEKRLLAFFGRHLVP